MRTLTLTNSLFNNLLTNWDKAFSDEDYSYWRRKGEGVRGVELNDSFEYYVPLGGFKKEEILLINNSGDHNDVIAVVERKIE